MKLLETILRQILHTDGKTRAVFRARLERLTMPSWALYLKDLGR